MQKNIPLRLFLALFGLIFSLQVLATADQPLSQRQDVKAFIQEMVHKHQFKEAQLNRWFNQAKIQPSILKSIAKPAEKLPWHKYEPIFISDKRINEGVEFWHQHHAALAKAEKEYGIPPEIIIAILGVETFYGKQAGKYNVLDALTTLAFDYPPRAKFFRSELEEFLLLSREEKWDPTTVKGSYAGAMGKAQFISSSYRRYAVDFDRSGRRDIIENVDDAIGSVANYFKLNGWKKGEIVIFPAKIEGEKHKDLIASGMNPKPNYTLQQLSASGVHTALAKGLQAKHLQSQSFALIAFEGKTGTEYWLGAHNFYVITRYNRSNHYAMAVYTLGQKIKDAYHHV